MRQRATLVSQNEMIRCNYSAAIVLAPISILRAFSIISATSGRHFPQRGRLPQRLKTSATVRALSPATALISLSRNALQIQTYILHPFENRQIAIHYHQDGLIKNDCQLQRCYSPALSEDSGISPTISCGSTRRPTHLMLQWRWGPVTRPVAPTAPMISPFSTRWPGSTSIRDM